MIFKKNEIMILQSRLCFIIDERLSKIGPVVPEKIGILYQYYISGHSNGNNKVVLKCLWTSLQKSHLLRNGLTDFA